MFPHTTVACDLRETADASLLFPEEAGTCGTFRPKRLADFAAGRLCARRALAQLGFENFALRRNGDHTPRWPEGIVGSITHTAGFCGAVADRRENVAGLGLDAEVVASVVPELWRQLLTGAELAELAPLAIAQGERLAALAFSAKEAFYKAQFGLTESWLDFTDVIVVAQPAAPERGTFSLRAALGGRAARTGPARGHGTLPLQRTARDLRNRTWARDRSPVRGLAAPR